MSTGQGVSNIMAFAGPPAPLRAPRPSAAGPRPCLRRARQDACHSYRAAFAPVARREFADARDPPGRGYPRPPAPLDHPSFPSVPVGHNVLRPSRRRDARLGLALPPTTRMSPRQVSRHRLSFGTRITWNSSGDSWGRGELPPPLEVPPAPPLDPIPAAPPLDGVPPPADARPPLLGCFM
jgi:hypothetical protein